MGLEPTHGDESTSLGFTDSKRVTRDVRPSAWVSGRETRVSFAQPDSRFHSVLTSDLQKVVPAANSLLMVRDLGFR
jgi:hypothetical protein